MKQLSGPRWFFYNFSSIGHALFDSIVLTYHLDFLLAPKETAMTPLVPEKIAGIIPVVGFLMVIGRIVDAFADPLIASRSDRSRVKFGRRRVFMLFGGLPLGISTLLIFFPPLQTTSWLNVIYMAFMFSLFFFFYTVYVAPYIALIPELGHNEEQRVKITSAQALFALIGAILAMMLGPNLMKLAGEGDPLRGYQIMVSILTVIGVIILYAAVFAVDEKKYSNAEPSALPLKESILTTLRNKHFIVFLGANLCFWFVFNVIRSSSLHIGQTMLGMTRLEVDGLFTPLFGVAGVGFIGIIFAMKKISKKILMLFGLGSFTLLSCLLALSGILPGDAKTFGLIIYALLGIPVAILLVIPNVFISELCDFDFRHTNQHREAMYFGVHGFFLKLNLGISTLITSAFFLFFGKDIANPLGVRLSILFAGLMALVGLLILLRYKEKEVKGL